MPVILTAENYDSIINNNIVLIDFSAKWCGPCRRLEPEFNAAEKTIDTKNVIFAVVDVDVSSDIAVKFNISSLPTLVLTDNGTVLASHKGVILREKIKKLVLDNICPNNNE